MPDRGPSVDPPSGAPPLPPFLGSPSPTIRTRTVRPTRSSGAAREVPARDDPEAKAWLERFHLGDRSILEEIYHQHFHRIDCAVGTVLTGADRETVVHEVFLRLLRDDPFRRAFHGGDVGAWLAAVARNQAIDYSRRRNREAPAGIDLAATVAADDELARSAEARILIERFLRDVLPPSWLAVFKARFVSHLSQAEAAALLGKRRTTLAYQELRIRRMLRKFLLEEA
jgi:RNA polymerase sigma-70 factor (ECF subfamily)